MIKLSSSSAQKSTETNTIKVTAFSSDLDQTVQRHLPLPIGTSSGWCVVFLDLHNKKFSFLLFEYS